MNNPKDATPEQIWSALHDPKISKYKATLGCYCKKCRAYHETFCKDATRKQIVDELAAILNQCERSARGQKKWFDHARNMAGKFAIVKHENNKLRKKYEAARVEIGELYSRIHKLQTRIEEQETMRD